MSHPTDFVLLLDSGETKNGEGRTTGSLTEECRQLLTELRKGKQPEDFVFTRGGKPVRDFRGTWDALVMAASIPGSQSAPLGCSKHGAPRSVPKDGP